MTLLILCPKEHKRHTTSASARTQVSIEINGATETIDGTKCFFLNNLCVDGLKHPNQYVKHRLEEGDPAERLDILINSKTKEGTDFAIWAQNSGQAAVGKVNAFGDYILDVRVATVLATPRRHVPPKYINRSAKAGKRKAEKNVEDQENDPKRTMMGLDDYCFPDDDMMDE